MSYAAFGDPEFIGNIPVRTEIEILPADKPLINLSNAVVINTRGKCSKRPRYLGFKVSEQIGIAVINSRGIKNLTKTTVIGDENAKVPT